MESEAKMSKEFMIYCDVDKTLIKKAGIQDYRWPENSFTIATAPKQFFLEDSGLAHLDGVYDVLNGNVKILREFKSRGYGIVIWSARGSAWSKKIAEHLNLEDVADFYLAKPARYIDDKPASEFMGEPLFFTEEDL